MATPPFIPVAKLQPRRVMGTVRRGPYTIAVHLHFIENIDRPLAGTMLQLLWAFETLVCRECVRSKPMLNQRSRVLRGGS